MNRSVLLSLPFRASARLLCAATSIVPVFVWCILTETTLLAQDPALAPAPMDATREGTLESYLAKRVERAMAAKWNVRVDVQMVAMPRERALALLPDLQSDDEHKVEQSWNAIQKLIADGQAELMGWPMLVTPDRVRAVIETIIEKRYPSEFEPPSVPQNFNGAPSAKKKEHSLVPTAFETRNTGTTLEVEPVVLDEGKRIYLSLAPYRVVFVGWKTYTTGKTADGGEAQIDIPDFGTTKATSELILENGKRSLIAVHRLEVPKDSIEFFIVHAVATQAR